jgi:hypothetical protein
MVMDDLFDITLETNLVKETKDTLDELNIMQCIKRQQDSVLEDFERERERCYIKRVMQAKAG